MSDATKIAELKERYNDLPPTIFDIAKGLDNRAARINPVSNDDIIRFAKIIMKKNDIYKIFLRVGGDKDTDSQEDDMINRFILDYHAENHFYDDIINLSLSFSIVRRCVSGKFNGINDKRIHEFIDDCRLTKFSSEFNVYYNDICPSSSEVFLLLNFYKNFEVIDEYIKFLSGDVDDADIDNFYSSICNYYNNRFKQIYGLYNREFLGWIVVAYDKWVRQSGGDFLGSKSEVYVLNQIKSQNKMMKLVGVNSWRS